MKHRNIQKLALLFAAAVLLTGCVTLPGGQQRIQKEGAAKAVLKEQGGNMAVNGDIQYTLRDNKALYENDQDGAVVTMYLTVRQGNEGEDTNHTWEEINAHSVYHYQRLGIEKARVEAILQVGDENGPLEGEFGYAATVPNAIVNIRGQSSSDAPQKSYKIEIKDGKGSYQEQKTINLNKHAYDGLRFKNKLCYDLMEELPGMIALRTQFVHLYVKDETVAGEAKFKDYGLYTQVEQPNKRFLKNHGFDRYGQLYKVNFFEFYRYPDVVRLKSDAEFDEAVFQEFLETKGDSDHRKLIAMLDDLNDYSRPIEEVFEKWFDRENFFSWMAFHILVGNVDTQSRNMLLYSPTNLDKWYFISWDNDASFSLTEKMLKSGTEDAGWEYGVSNYWGNILFCRILKSDTYRKVLDDKIEEYRKIITEEKLTSMIAVYNKVIWKYRNQMPDRLYTILTNEQYLKACKEVPKELSENYRRYKQSLECPMPFYIGTPKKKGDGLLINWDNAYDFDMEDVTYTFELAKDCNFEDVLIRKKDLVCPECESVALEPGQYFVKVIARNKSGYEQVAFDSYSMDGTMLYGVKCFYVLEDGSIEGDVYEE